MGSPGMPKTARSFSDSCLFWLSTCLKSSPEARALAALLVSVAQFAWQVYRDLRKDQQAFDRVLRDLKAAPL